MDEMVDGDGRKLSVKQIIGAARARGWKVTGFTNMRPLLMLQIPGRQQPVFVYSAAPPQTSYVAAKIAKNKFITSQILASAGLPVPAEVLVGRSGDASSDAVTTFLQLHKPVVVKPLDAAHGKGITVGITKPSELKRALVQASQYASAQHCLVQEYIPGVDVRVLLIGYRYAGAISRQPATVVGDGKSTARQLIERTNASVDRGINYRSALSIIPMDVAERYMGHAIERVPDKGQAVQVVGISNMGTGGERHNIDTQVPAVLIDMATTAAKMLRLPVCGVDFMTSKIPQATDTLRQLQPRIIEVNECPGLIMHNEVDNPAQKRIIEQYLDFVASIDK